MHRLRTGVFLLFFVLSAVGLCTDIAGFYRDERKFLTGNLDPIFMTDSQRTTVESSSLVPQVWVFGALSITGGLLDLWSKEVVFRWRGLPAQNDIWWVIEPYFGIETAVNLGAVFGLGQGQGGFFATMSIIAAVAIIAWLFWFRAAESWWLTVALGLVGGGIIGNLYDRLGLWWQDGYPKEWQSGVRDWILWQVNSDWKWPNFNIADSLLVVGAGMLLYQSFFPPVPNGAADSTHDAGDSSGGEETGGGASVDAAKASDSFDQHSSSDD